MNEHLGSQTDRTGQQREQSRYGNRQPEVKQAVVRSNRIESTIETMVGRNADGVSAEADEGGMAE